MADQLAAYINRTQQMGMAPQEVHDILVNAGWSKDLVREAINKAYPLPIKKTSTFEKLRLTMLILIALRICLFPIRYFLAPLQLTPQSFAQYVNLPVFGNIGLISAVLPLFWIIPLYAIYRRQKYGYYLAVVFAILLIFVNIFTLMNIITSSLFLVLSAVYFITGFTLIFLAIGSLSYFPTALEQPPSLTNFKDSHPELHIITAFVFILVDMLAVILFVRNSTTEFLMSDLITVVVAAIFGWMCTRSMIRNIMENKEISGLGALFGFLNGAIAQLPIYGFSAIQIIAFPVGGFIGVLGGLVGINLLAMLYRKVLVK